MRLEVMVQVWDGVDCGVTTQNLRQKIQNEPLVDFWGAVQVVLANLGLPLPACSIGAFAEMLQQKTDYEPERPQSTFFPMANLSLRLFAPAHAHHTSEA